MNTTDKVTISYFFFQDKPTNSFNPVQQVKFFDGKLCDILKLDSQMLDIPSSSNKPLLLTDILLVSESNHQSASNFIPTFEQPLHQQLVFNDVSSTIW